MSTKTILTHSGGFHADDLFAVATLSLLFPDAEIVRTRDPKEIAAADYVVDVGNVYDPAQNRFDHHQRGGAGTHDSGVPYAAFGLVWKHVGATLCDSEAVAEKIKHKLVEPIDAFDNGVDLCDTNIPDVHPYIIEQLFFALEPTWQEKGHRSTDDGFQEAVVIAKQVLLREIAHARAFVEGSATIKEVYQHTKDKRIVLFDEAHVFERSLITDVLAAYPKVRYAVRKHEGGLWQAVAAVDSPHSFETRKPFPAAWAGKRDEELAEATGVPDAVYCANKCFMCIAKSKAGAMKLAELALEA